MTDETTGAVAAGGMRHLRPPLAGLLAILLFAAGMLQFAGLAWRAWPAESRVNDGRLPTFFAVHINPYGVFSEDFHLYAVRAKRIRDRGWSDSLLYRREGAGTNYVAPIQVLIGRLAVATGGEPVRYACLLTVLLTVVWSGLYLAVRRWLPVALPWGLALFAVLVTVQWESTLYFLYDPPFSADQWPVHRGLRLATNSWTSPLLTAVLLLASSLPFAERVPPGRWVGLAVLLGALAGADNWSFAVAWLSCGWMLPVLFLAGRAGGTSIRAKVPAAASLTAVLGGTWLVHKLLTTSLAGDVSLRSGIGPEWLSAVDEPSLWVHIALQWGASGGFWTVAAIVVLAGMTFIGHGSTGDAQTGRQMACQLLTAASLPLLAMLTLLPVLRRSGMELYLAYQVYWRIDFVLLLVLMLLAGEVVRRCVSWYVQRSGQTAGTAVRAWSTLIIVALCSQFVVHQLRIERFIRKVAARDFFLTADAERLRDWLQDYERRKGAFSLATLSHELNYLSAYWTDADLLLPEGFPYHSAADNGEIRRRTVDLLRLYGATPESWDEFAKPGQGNDQEDWHKSRTLSTQEGFLYYLYHRAAQLRSVEHPRWALEEKERIAEELGRSGGEIPQPDVIVIDGAARAIGTARLDGYERAFAHGDLEAWVRRGDPALHPD